MHEYNGQSARTRSVRGILGYPDATSEEIERAMALGVRDALIEHKRIGNSIVTWDDENQRVVEIPAEEIVIPEGFDGEDEGAASTDP